MLSTRFRFALPGVAAVLMFAFGAPAMWAHAILMRSTPAPHAAMSAAGFAIELHYNSRVDGARSKLTLTTKAGTSVTLPLAAMKQAAPDTLTSASAALAPGDYVLHWIVLASDGHISRGEIPFTVK